VNSLGLVKDSDVRAVAIFTIYLDGGRLR